MSKSLSTRKEKSMQDFIETMMVLWALVFIAIAIWVFVTMPRKKFQTTIVTQEKQVISVITGNSYTIDTKKIPQMNSIVYYMVDNGNIKNDARIQSLSFTNEWKLLFHVCRETKEYQDASEDICLKEVSRRDQDCTDTFFVWINEEWIKDQLCNQ